MENGELPTEGVVPHAGTWIEIMKCAHVTLQKTVVPHAGTWIEIYLGGICIYGRNQSFPTRERGLKFSGLRSPDRREGRSPRGNMD